MKLVVTANYYSSEERPVGALLVVDEKNNIYIENAQNAESFDSFHRTLTCTHYDDTYVLFNVATKERIIHKSMINTASYMIKINTDMTFPFAHHNIHANTGLKQLTDYNDPFDYLNYATSFSFSNNYYLNSIDNKLGISSDSWNILFEDESVVIEYKNRNDFIDFKVDLKESISIEKIIQITKSINYFVSFYRGYSAQINQIKLANMCIPFFDEFEIERTLYPSYDFSCKKDSIYYLYQPRITFQDDNDFVSKYSKWFYFYEDHSPLIVSFFSPYGSTMLSTTFVESLRRLEYLYNYFYRNFDDERIRTLLVDLENFYKNNEFSTYISDSSFRKEYRKNIPSIHQQVISNVVHHASYGRKSLSQWLKEIDKKNRIETKVNASYLEDLRIFINASNTDIFTLIQNTRNSITHFDLKKDKVIPEHLQGYLLPIFDDIFIDLVTDLLK